MKIRKLIVTAAIAASVLTLLTCSWWTNTGQGQLSLTFSGVTPRGDWDYFARVYLLADGRRFALTGTTEYIQVPMSDVDSTTVVVDGIPVGPEYSVLAAVVQQRPEGWFSTEAWGGSSEPFQVTPGKIISIPISFQSWPDFYPVDPMMGKNIKDVESDGTTVYVADAGNVHVGDLLNLWGSWSTYPVTSGHTINSLSMGIDLASVPNVFPQLWANTDRGILPLNGAGFIAPLTDQLGSVSVLDSTVGYDSTWMNYVLYFRRSEGLGGVYIPESLAPDPSQWNWVNLNTDRVLDMALGVGGGAAFATFGSAFRVPETLLLDSTPSLAEHRTNLAGPAPIRSLYIFDNDAVEDLYIGTEDGAWRDEAWDFPDQGLIREPGTQGCPIRRVVFEAASSYWRAYLSDVYIFVVDNSGSLVGKYPFVSGFPGRVNSIEWAYDGGSWAYLFVATDRGLVYANFFVGGI